MPELAFGAHYQQHLRVRSDCGPRLRTVLERDDFVVPRSTTTHPPWLPLQSAMANGRPPSMLNDAVFELIQGEPVKAALFGALASAMN